MFQIDQTGHFPPTVVPIQKRMSTSGPMGKSVRDMKRMYQLIAKKHEEKTELEQITIQFLPEDQPFPLSAKSKKRSEERRVGKECRTRCAAEQKNNKKT